MTTPALHIRVDADTELRLLSEKDAPALFQLLDQNRTYLRQWLPWLDLVQTVENERMFLQGKDMQYREHNGFGCGIWYQGCMAGTISYHPIDWFTRKVEIGYWLAAQFQGRGLMTRSCMAMIAYAFNSLQLNKVEIRCATGNARSRAIPLRLGFTLEGNMRQAEWLYDHYVDLVLYGMLASEWAQLHPNT